MAGPSSVLTTGGKTNLLAGVGSLWYGATDATLPLDTAVASALDTDDFTHAGGVTDGLTMTVEQEFFGLRADGIPGDLAHRLTNRNVQMATNLAEATLENLLLVLNNAGAITTGGTGATAYKKFSLLAGVAAMFPDGICIIVDGWAPGGDKRRRVIMRDCISIENVESPMKVDEQTVFPVTFQAREVDDSTSPVTWTDEVGA